MDGLFPKVYFVPSPNATEEEICSRMQELAEEHDLTVIRINKVSDKDFRITPQKVKPRPKSLFLDSGGVRIPKYLHVYKEKNSHGNDTIQISTRGNVLILPNRLLGEIYRFGILVDDSKPKDAEVQTPS